MSATSSTTASGRRSEVVHKGVERVGECGSHLPRQMRVNLGGAGAAVTEGLLDNPQVDAGLQQMCRIGMAQRVNVSPLGDAAAVVSVRSCHVPTKVAAGHTLLKLASKAGQRR